MARLRIALSTAGARDLAIGFGLTSAVLALALAVWPHSGVAGTLTRFVCQPGPANAQKCSIEPARASISLSPWLPGSSYYGDTSPSRQLRSDAAGHFHLDLPPGGYWLSAVGDSGEVGGATFPVFAGQVAQVQILLVRSIALAQCLASDDHIATPTGPVPVTQVRPGMIVWTMGAAGQRVAAPVMMVRHTPAPPGHRMLRLSLADGRVVEASPGHPTADGRHLSDLTPGDILDGSRINKVDAVPYVGDTWDLLPAGPTGTYWADGVLLGSTLAG